MKEIIDKVKNSVDIEVHFKDLDIAKNLIDLLNEILQDAGIPAKIRDHYSDEVNKVLKQ